MTTRRTAAAALVRAAGVAGCTRRPAQSRSVTIEGFAYQPAALVISPGDTVVWTNRDIVPHTATARDSVWDSGAMAEGGSWRLSPRSPGRHDYYCVFHPNMRGTIEVR